MTQSIADVIGVAGLVLLVLAVLSPEPGYGRLGLGLVIFGGFLRLRRIERVGVSDNAARCGDNRRVAAEGARVSLLS